MKKPILLIILFGSVISGCTTEKVHKISVRTMMDPSANHTQSSPIAVDSQTDVGIEDRKYFVEVPEILRELGFNVIDSEEAKYILFFKFKKGLEYDPKSENYDIEFGREESVNGIIDAGLFKLNEDKKSFVSRSEWEGFVEVDNYKDRDKLKESLELLMKNFQNEINRDYIIEEVVSQPVAGGDAVRWRS